MSGKLQQLRESDHEEAFCDHLERIWSSIPAEAQADASASMSELIDGILGMKGSAPSTSAATASFSNRRMSRNATPLRSNRQSSAFRKDSQSDSKHSSVKLSFAGAGPSSSFADESEKLDALRAKLDAALKAKKDTETELSIAKEYVKVANMNLEASNAQRDGMKERLAIAENTIEALEDKVNETQKLVSTIPQLQKTVQDAESYSKYMADRMRELTTRLEEEERKNLEMSKKLSQANTKEALLSQQLKDALARNGAPASDAAKAANRFSRRIDADDRQSINSVAETAK